MAMDLLRLDDTTRRAAGTVEGWDSLIWTERYNDLGEFELQTSKINYFMTTLPLDSYVAIMQSDQPMKVENHAIDIDDDGAELLTVSGRAAECFLEDRTNGPVLQPVGTSPRTGVPVVAPNILNYIISTLELHLTDTVNIIPLSYDLIPDLVVQAEFSVMSTPNYTVPDDMSDLYTKINTLLKNSNYGIRTIRAKGTDVGFVLSVYNGNDKTEDVVFRISQGHIKVKSYLFSTKGYKNVGYIQAVNSANRFNAAGDSTVYTGLDRRELIVDGSDMTIAAGTSLTSMQKARTQAELAKNKKTKSFDFELLPSNPYVFGVDYFLGDVVRAEADYGLSQDMRVSEFIRTQDETGYKEYPTLAENTPVEYS